MSGKELVRRYCVFGAALFVSAFGVSLVTKSALGTSPISSIPYVMSLNTRLSMGTYIFLLNMVLIAAQMLMLGRKGIWRKRTDLVMQVPVSVLFGLFIDLSMAVLSSYDPQMYALKVISLVAGCAVLALGVSLEVVADVTMVSGEYTVQIASKRFGMQFGNVKIGFDVLLVVVAVLLSLLLSGGIEGVREGTVITALLTGPFVRLFGPLLEGVRRWEEGPRSEVPRTEAECPVHNVVTISREYGSGGHSIGERIARDMGYAFYDSELISLSAKEACLAEDFVRDNEQSLPGNVLWQMVMQDYEAPLEKSLSPEDALFVAQSRVIRRLAAKGPCVIVGRCADYVLGNVPGVLRAFVHSGRESALRRVSETYGVPADRAESEIARINRSREAHYGHYTGRHWGDCRNYDMTFDTGRIGEDAVCGMVEAALKG